MIVLCLAALFMLPTYYLRGRPHVDFLSTMDLTGILFWVFYISFGLTSVFMVIDQTDLAKLSAMVNTGSIVFVILAGFIRSRMYWYSFPLQIWAYLDVAVSVIALLVVRKYAKTKT